MFRTAYYLLGLLLLAGCQKEIASSLPQRSEPVSLPLAATDFIKYNINAGEHFCDKNDFKAVESDQLKFVVRFDSSAVYQTIDPANQEDINKLYGFSDNGAQHHQFSARFGWRWSSGALRLFGYVYNNGLLVSKEIGTVLIGGAVECNLQVTSTHYRFTVGGIKDSLPRLSRTPTGKGYKLYPYFGGDEPAPHAIRIHIKDL